MWILLSSVVMTFVVLELHFLIDEGTDCCFSGVSLKTVCPAVTSRDSCECAATASASGVVLTVMIETGERGCRLSEPEPFPTSGPLALEMVVMVTGDLALSGPDIASPAFVFDVTVVGLGTMVMRGF